MRTSPLVSVITTLCGASFAQPLPLDFIPQRPRKRVPTSWILVLLFSMLPAGVQAQFNYTINTDLTVTITGYTGPGGAVTIPSTISGLPVTTIATSAFPQPGVTNIIIPSSVTNIQDSAFSGCSTLLAINVDGNNSYYCSGAGVLFDKGQTTLIQYPLARGGNYAIPNSVTNVGKNAFANCITLSSVTMPNSVSVIGDSAFFGCTALPGITIPDSVTDIGRIAFKYCSGLTNVTMGSRVANIEVATFAYCAGLASMTIPNSVRSIGDEAFWGCGSLRDMIIPNSVAYLGTYAFRDCGSLTSATLGTRITNILDFAFYNCGSLTNAPINGIVNIGAYAFANCFSLPSVNIPDSVTNIGRFAFSSSGLFSVTISATWMGEAAFYGCNNLTNVIINNGVRNIARSGFAYCSSLTTVTIGRDVGDIGGYAFSPCPNLTAVYFQGAPPVLDCCGITPCCVFGAPHSILYFVPGTPGWGAAFADRPAVPLALPYPVILNSSTSLGVQSNGFGFTVSWATNLSVVVETSTNLANPAWQRLQTITLTGGSYYFTDPQWTNYPNRFYRIRSP